MHWSPMERVAKDVQRAMAVDAWDDKYGPRRFRGHGKQRRIAKTRRQQHRRRYIRVFQSFTAFVAVGGRLSSKTPNVTDVEKP